MVVAGKLRGEEFILNDGDNVIGRDAASDIQIEVDGVSKRHLNLSVTKDAAYVQDLGSSNGTFVNGKIVKRGTLKNGDKITLPDVIMQLVYVKEKKKIIKKSISKGVEEEIDEFVKAPPMPAKIHDKLLHIFRYKIMPFLHGINEEYEWKVLFAIVLSVFVFLTIALTIFPVLEDSKKLLLNETALRGAHFAEEIGRINARALEQKNLESVDTNFLKTEEGVASYELFDLDGRIVRPIERLNEYIHDVFSIRAREWATNGNQKSSNTLKILLDDGEIGIAHRIMAYNTRMGISEAVGVIAIRFTPQSLAIESTKNSKAFLESLIISGLVAIVFFGIIYYLTIRPLEELRYQIDEVQKGKQREIEGKLLMHELKPLKNSINSILQRLREFQAKESGEVLEEEDSGPYLETLRQFYESASGPCIILDSQKQLLAINPLGEDVTGIRQSGSEGMSILDISREQGFAATIIEACDNSANNAGTAQSAHYDLQGRPYKIVAVALLGRDNFSKGFLISFIKEE